MTARLLFRADCGPDIGLGHVMRCFALASAAVARGHRVALATRDPTAAALRRWRDLGADVTAFADRPDAAAAAGLVAMARSIGAATVVIDRYGLSPTFFDLLAAGGLSVVALDDLGRDDPPCELVVNPNPGAEVRFADAYRRSRQRRLGATHALIRPEVTATQAIGGGGILVTLGGSDLARATRALARSLARALPDTAIVAVAADTVDGVPPVGVDLRAPCDLAPLLANADLVVCGGGVTALEAAHLGRPAVLVVLADNQRPGAETLAAAGAARLAEGLDDVASVVVALMADREARAAMSAAGRGLIDGRGAARVLAAIEAILPVDGAVPRTRS